MKFEVVNFKKPFAEVKATFLSNDQQEFRCLILGCFMSNNRRVSLKRRVSKYSP